MTALAYHPLRMELQAADRRTRRMTLFSVGGHVALLLLWLLLQRFVPEPMELVEITWIDPQPAIAAAPAPAPVPIVSEPAPEAPAAAKQEEVREERFERPLPKAPVAPAPQRPDVSSDKLKTALDDLRVAPPKADLSKLAAAGPTSTTRAVALPSPTVSGNKEQLVRGEHTERPTPTALERRSAPTSPRTSSLARVDVARPTSPSTGPQTLDDSVARRSIEGAMLMGEVADRPLLDKTMPVYPERARREAVEATVTLRFVVLADGRVNSNVRVERSSGHADFDRNAIDALRTWRFAPLSGGKTGEQWGAITFEFRLRDR